MSFIFPRIPRVLPFRTFRNPFRSFIPVQEQPVIERSFTRSQIGSGRPTTHSKRLKPGRKASRR